MDDTRKDRIEQDRRTCPCGSGKRFASCCQRFLSGQEPARTPEQLMRSRFSAYALGGYGRYLLQTWHPATAKGLTEAMLDRSELRWRKLAVLNRTQKGDQGMVEFDAYYSNSDDPQSLRVMHEKSEFVRINGRWLYLGGQVS
jgi:SEC-C motif-containing protein